MSSTPDEFGPGTTFFGAGFPRDVPLEMTFANERRSQTLTERQFPELRSDVRGAFEIHLFAAREDIGTDTLVVAGGGCTAETTVTTSEMVFPPECSPKTNLPPPNASASKAYAQLLLDDDPSQYWRFEDMTASVVADEFGASADLEGAFQLGQSGVAGSRSVLANGEGWIDLPDIELAADFTIEAWLAFCGDSISQEDGLVGQGGEGPDLNFFAWRFRLWDGDRDVAVADRKMSSRGWQHVVATRSGDELGLWVDGAQFGTATYTQPFSVKVLGSGNAGSFQGWLDEFAIYEHTLGGNRIKSRYELGK